MNKFGLPFVLLLFLVSFNVFAQKEGVVHPRFRALLQSGERIEGKNGYFTSADFIGVLDTGEELRISKNDIKVLDVSSGSKAGQYALMGAGVGLLTSLTAIISAASEVSEDPDLELNTGAIVSVTLGVTGISALVGGIIGANQTKWTRVPIRTSFKFELNGEGTRFTVYVPIN
jgi:hypothetical protein